MRSICKRLAPVTGAPAPFRPSDLGERRHKEAIVSQNPTSPRSSDHVDASAGSEEAALGNSTTGEFELSMQPRVSPPSDAEHGPGATTQDAFLPPNSEKQQPQEEGGGHQQNQAPGRGATREPMSEKQLIPKPSDHS
jgi:hypothetical protein